MNPQLLAFLTIPVLLERGVAALERIANGTITGTPTIAASVAQATTEEPEAAPAKPAAKRAPKAAAAPAGPTPEELLAKMSELVTPAMEKDPSLGSKFVAIAQKHGGTRFSDIPAANLPAALADVEALCEGSVNSATKLF